MSLPPLCQALTIGWFALAMVILPTLCVISAPYGRHTRGGWGPALNNKLGWVIMEAPAALIFAAGLLLGRVIDTITVLIFFGLWETHYIQRAFVYPFTLRGRDKQMPVAVMGLGMCFNLVNGYLNSQCIFGASYRYTAAWLRSPQFLIGLALFLVGFGINRQADEVLRSLRRPGESGYRIPRGGLYRWISCPNYLGEMIEWTGWAIATWSLAGLAFAVWTAANLVPRARAHHVWYHERFADYPGQRKALVPGLW
jgi:3-oxo-5-alpha-steroid 4-dehydrogenase 1